MNCFVGTLMAASAPAAALAGSINTDVALTPRRGGSLFRLQYDYSEAAGPSIEQVNMSTVKGT